MKRYALFFDIDGTIATYQQPISRKLKQILPTLKKQGHKLFICTGRGYSDIPADIRALKFDGYICSTGAYVKAGKEVIYSAPLPPACVHTLCRRLKDAGISAYFESSRQIYRSEANVPLDHSFPDFQDAPADTKVYSAAYYLAPDQDISLLISCLDAIAVRSVPQSDRSGDILLPYCNKAAGMQLLLSYLHLEDYDTIAFGDSPNDVEMLQAADLGIAMGHAPDILKQHADRITGTFEEDGVYTALKEIFGESR